MNHSDIAALMRGAAPAIRDYVASAMRPLALRIADLERELEAARSVDHGATIKVAVDAAFAQMRVPADGKDADPAEIARLINDAVGRIPAPENGKDADPEQIRAMVAEAVGALPPASPGKDADMDAIARMVEETVTRAVADIEPRGPDADVLRGMVADEVSKLPPAEPGKDALPPTVDELRAIMGPLVAGAVQALPKALDGKSVTAEDVAPLVQEQVSKAVSALPVPKDGAPGKLPVAKAWSDGVHYEGDVRTHKGALWQATKDTGREPGHEDWICLAAAGSPGVDADQIEICGTFDPGKTYRRLNIVALNGGAFIAKVNDPGDCPGDGWQVIAMRGKPGQPGQSVKGDPGKSIKGEPGPAVASITADDQGLLTLVNGDGSTVECDLYPLLAKVT
ncbi:hypothetical protein [Devosia sp. Root635]|uniref:hypothetical protein n=1 Tax=Devosia sp. Root635 TaxID=1736575 RepID=UPI0006F663D0|nr:hypothetical protein [Devosia sp. Root635]KRA42099.1 hypothetical protein ASD80_10250 [Devosia sp. Root635]